MSEFNLSFTEALEHLEGGSYIQSRTMTAGDVCNNIKWWFCSC